MAKAITQTPYVFTPDKTIYWRKGHRIIPKVPYSWKMPDYKYLKTK